MRKQTKLVAVLSAAALLAIGASMTSFAATGWQEENGTWVYYDKDGSQVTNEWQKSGNNWFYLSDNGEMATDAIVEDNNNYYYVDMNGSMVTNQWVQVENEDYDGDDEQPINNWYYFQANGKALKGSDNNSINLKTVNGKKYVFDDDAKMLYGWVNGDGERETGDEAWQGGEYYFGDENDGAMTLGWLQLSIVDTSATEGDNVDTAFSDEDQDRFFYFKTNGKKMTSETGKTINGKKYAFDSYGRMTAEWSKNYTASISTAGIATAATGSTTTDTGVESTRWRYYGTPENGARVTKGWFQVVPAEGLNAKKYNDDEEKWYYSDNEGRLVANELKTINGKKFGFDDKGGMISGLKFLSVAKGDKNRILTVHDDAYYDTEEEFDEFANGLKYAAGEMEPALVENSVDDYITYSYYFGSGDDGSMKTGKQTVSIDGEDFSFLFNKSGGTKGAGKLGIDTDKYYLGGKLMKASKEDKYSVIMVFKAPNGTITNLALLTTDKFATSPTSQSADGKKTTYTIPSNGTIANTGGATVSYVLVNTSGTVEKKDKAKAKDGDGLCYTVKNGVIIEVYEEN